MRDDTASDGATRPSCHPDAMPTEGCKQAYSHLRGKRRRRSLLTAADVAVLVQRRAEREAAKLRMAKGK